MPKKDPFELPYMQKKIEKEKREDAAADSVDIDIHRKKNAIKKARKEDFENVIEERVAEAQEKESKRAKKSPQEKTKKAKEKMEEEIERSAKLKKMRQELGISKMTKEEKMEAGWSEAIEEAEKKLEEAPDDVDTKFDFSDMDAEKEGEEIEIGDEDIVSAEDEDIVSAEEIDSKQNKELGRHLRANLSDYPELLTADIKKNLQIIMKNEDIIEKNKNNAKKSAQDKVKKAKKIIEQAQTDVNDYANDLAKQYNGSHNHLMDLSRELFGEQKPGKKKASGGMENELNAMYQKKFGRDKSYNPERKGFFGSIKGFFNDRKIKKVMGEDWDDFQVKEAEYKQKLDEYNKLLASHGKRFGRLEEARESGSAHPLYVRGKGEKLGRGM